MTDALLVRPVADADVDAITSIYARHVAEGTATFETVAPDRTEIAGRCRAVAGRGWPWLVAERAGAVVGYAYADAFRPRAAYRWCLEDSIYLASDVAGRGIGRLLLAELLARSTASGARQMMAVIGDSSNAASIGVHRALGFAHVGTMQGVGWKHGRWLDVVVMQKALGPGCATPPAPA